MRHVQDGPLKSLSQVSHYEAIPMKKRILFGTMNQAEMMDFQDALISVYCENPCQVLPNAIWKTLAELESLETSLEVEGNVIAHLEAWGERELFLYWDRNQANIPHHHLTDLRFALIHQDFVHAIPTAHFITQKRYFRLIHRNEPIPKAQPPAGFGIVNVDVGTESHLVADLIGRCYADLHPSEESVRGWMHHPVFDPELWIWVIDEKKGGPVGLGIAEVDFSVSEASLEWIQVLPSYRGRGLGKSIVRELLSRLRGRVAFTTVSGEVDNQTSPEALYRSCGFRGNDIWWVLRS